MTNQNLLTRLLRPSYQSRQGQQYHSQNHNRQDQIKNHDIIHNLLLSKYNDTNHDNPTTISPDRIIIGSALSIQKGITTEANATWAKSAQIEAILSSWFSVKSGAFSIKHQSSELKNRQKFGTNQHNGTELKI